MSDSYKADLDRTTERRNALQEYFEAEVLGPGGFVCHSAVACKSSHGGQFWEGQLHHIGRHYDLFRNEKPFRWVVVGQEYGHGPSHVHLSSRYKMIYEESGFNSRFKKTGSFQARNKHMRGCTSLLRLAFGLRLGDDFEGEFISIESQKVHIFDCFALVNILLCSAVSTDASSSDEPPKRLEGMRGRSTRVMRSNCSGHFRTAIKVLQPNIIAVQGRGIRRWMGELDLFDEPPTELFELVERVTIQGHSATLLSFCHPSAPRGCLDWGSNERTSYLTRTVAPTVQQMIQMIE